MRALQTPPISTFLCTYLGANTDKVDHIQLLGNNTFGFEDLANGGEYLEKTTIPIIF